MNETETAPRIEFIRRDLRRLIVPLLIEQLLSITVGLADSMMVAQVGEAAVSAVSLVDSVNVLLVQAFSALATGGAVISGQYLGRRQADRASHSGTQLMLFMAEFSLFITGLMYLLRPFVLHTVFGAVAPDVAAYAETYYLITAASIPFLAVYSAGAALFRVMGNAAISMEVSLVMNAINVAGNGILIFGFHRGVEGVAIPTLVSRAVAAVMILLLLRRPSLPVSLRAGESLRPDPVVIRNILYFGVPNGAESGMFQLGKILLLSTVATLGTASVAANAISNTIGNFQILPASAIGLGIVTVAARCVGTGDYGKTRYYVRRLMKTAYLFMIPVNAAILLCLPLILRLYRVSAEAQGYARTIVCLHGVICTVVWPLAFALPQALRAAGDTRFTLIVSSVSMWTFRVIIGVAMVRCWNFGVLGMWIAMFIDWAARTICFVLRYHGHRWEVARLKE